MCSYLLIIPIFIVLFIILNKKMKLNFEDKMYKICVHVPFFYKVDRLSYFYKIINNFNNFPNEFKIDIYIYTNIPDLKIPFSYNRGNIFIKSYNFTNIIEKDNYLYDTEDPNHPFYLTHKNRNVIPKLLNKYDYFIYQEDDIDFTYNNFKYWLKYKDICERNNIDLGFMRIEFNKKNNKWCFSDIVGYHEDWKDIIEIDSILFTINKWNYKAFWIYDKSQLKRFINGKYWNSDNIDNYSLRVRSAIGNTLDYSFTVIPLNNNLKPVKGAFVHHLPNNYTDQKNGFCMTYV